MFKRIIFVDGRRGRRKRLIELECDNCKKFYVKNYYSNLIDSKKLTFCSVKCSKEASRIGGASHQKSKKVLFENHDMIQEKKKRRCLEKYGVEHHTRTDEVKKKYRDTCLKRYGVENVRQSAEIQEKSRVTCLKRYGVEHGIQSKQAKKKCNETWLEKYGGHPMFDPIVKEKVRRTCVERYGVDTFSKLDEYHEKFRNTCLERYGVEHSSQDRAVKEKTKVTCIEKYGVKYACQSDQAKKKRLKTWKKKYGGHPLNSKDVQEKLKKTSLERYGVDHPMKSEEVRSKIDYDKLWKKSHETMKRNGSYGKSKVEDSFYDFLNNLYGEGVVDRQRKVNGWNIDFYVESSDLYVQFDGVYWHGLDRPIEVIEKLNDKRSKSIYETFLKDKRQNEWFEKNGLKLIRVTDREFKKDKDRVCKRLLNHI